MSYEMPVEYGKVLEFARATQSSNPAYTETTAVIPATFLTTARMVWEPLEQTRSEARHLDARRLLHGEEEYVFYGQPPRAGQSLHVETRLDKQWEKEGRRGGVMRFVRIINEFRDPAGNVVAEQRSTIIETSRPADLRP